ncbi:VOC family protein [Ferruginibacter sp. HRS2-29]|uniref:VOC family protein n=1 Tax=Ferruginibacter sp. HRS2-29 TaxID=2487334 RepID=UPI0020CCC694|nr:VOC family protein [Ferruginibacter sp. HRS2-29]MCP9753127.1 VOC family protein [Ferruginibacter sp. HRS2-29]
MALLNPYVSFDGNCKEAMNFYKDALGGDLVINLVNSMPEMAAQMPDNLKDHVLHSVLTNGGLVLMGTDMCRDDRIEGTTVHLNVNCENDEEVDDIFNKLSAGGKVVESPKDMPWGGRFAAFDDKFGKHWMLNFQKR